MITLILYLITCVFKKEESDLFIGAFILDFLLIAIGGILIEKSMI